MDIEPTSEAIKKMPNLLTSQTYSAVIIKYFDTQILFSSIIVISFKQYTILFYDFLSIIFQQCRDIPLTLQTHPIPFQLGLSI